MLIRPFQSSDDVEALTNLLHVSYKRLADMGLHFMATHQSAEVTARRVQNSSCLVGILNGELVATISYRDAAHTSGTPHYDRPDVASFGQFAVLPAYQGRGYGGMLHQAVLDLARADGVTELALDTAESAYHLIDLYRHWGYRFIEYTKWKEVNYRSVIMSRNVQLLSR